MLETFLCDSGPCYHDCITYLLQIFLAAHSYNKSPILPPPKGALMDLDLVTEEVIEVPQTHCHDHGTKFYFVYFMTWHIILVGVEEECLHIYYILQYSEINFFTYSSL